MPQIAAEEFQGLPLRVHTFLAGVPLHDVWAIDLPRTRPGITLDEFLRTGQPHAHGLPPIVRILLGIRFAIGRLLGWDREPAATGWEPFVKRLTTADRSESLAAPGTSEGFFRVVYRFENEQLLEVVNRTAHAAAVSALVELPNTYRFYFAVYVRKVGRFTPVYMALIDPFRKLIVYPSLMRNVRAHWKRTFATPRSQQRAPCCRTKSGSSFHRTPFGVVYDAMLPIAFCSSPGDASLGGETIIRMDRVHSRRCLCCLSLWRKLQGHGARNQIARWNTSGHEGIRAFGNL